MNYTSDSLFLKNYELFKNRFPQFAQLVSKEKAKKLALEGISKIEFFQSKTGVSNANFCGKALHSKYDPKKEAETLSKTEDAKNFDTSIFFGYGLAYAPIEFALQNPEKNLVIIEPDLEFAFLPFFTTDLESLFKHQNLILLFGLNFNEIIGFLDAQKIEAFNAIKNQTLMSHNIEYFSQLEILLKRNKQKQDINRNTLKAYGKLWIGNCCRNFDKIQKLNGVSVLKNAFPGKKAIVLAAGPTLSETLPFLKQISESCITICVDTALKQVLKTGIKPDFVVVMDSQYWNSRHLDFTSCPDSVLVTESAVHPSVLRKQWKEILLCNSQYPFGNILEENIELGKLGAGGSVATTSWDFARYIGCTSIFMAGLDLGFPKNQTHTKGATFEKWALMSSTRINSTESFSMKSQFDANAQYGTSYDGQRIRTDSRMKLYAWWFESKCAEFPEIKTYSLSEKSLKIPGIQVENIQTLMQEPKMDSCVRKEINEKLKKETDNSVKFKHNLENFLINPKENRFCEQLEVSFPSIEKLVDFVKKSIQ